MIDVDPAVAKGIRLLVLDVDGVLTNAHLVLGPSGEEIKQFSVRDGIGIKLAQFAGIEVAFLSARVSEIVVRRAEMLGVSEVHQGEQHKLQVIERMASERRLRLNEIAYVGDDLVDLEAVAAVGVGVAVGDGCEDLKAVAGHVASTPGGLGAVRETVEAILRARGNWQELVRRFLESI
jgi:3-deoxy-D-manno-octulosonate 8-phosphate phosphatase (KDO 8-P phosphatase)